MYKIIEGPSGELCYVKMMENGGVAFVENPDNADWQEYKKWIEEGNTPEQAALSTPMVTVDEAEAI